MVCFMTVETANVMDFVSMMCYTHTAVIVISLLFFPVEPEKLRLAMKVI